VKIKKLYWHNADEKIAVSQSVNSEQNHFIGIFHFLLWEMMADVREEKKIVVAFYGSR
jgi:hypothetical protein